MKPNVLVTEGSDPKPLDWLKQHADVIECRYDDPSIDQHLAAADGLVVRTYTRVNAALLERAPKLRVVGRGGVGLENIDVRACRARNVEVVYTPDANTLAVGDFVFGYLLDVRSQLDFDATPVDKPRLYRDADILTLHVDMRPGNEHLVAAPQLALMKRDAVLINTSRGEVLDAHALATALREGRLAGAAIDVYDPEPPGEDFPLLGLPNVLLTPHMAARTHTAIENMSWVVRDVLAVLQGEKPRYPAP